MTSLARASVTEQGVLFETGTPVVFRYVRNTEKAPWFGARFQQDLEPAGRYVIHNEEPGDMPRGWETEVVALERPLVILFNDPLEGGVRYDATSWKARLWDIYGATGADLTRLLLADGWDGVVTVDGVGTREIVLLAPLKTNPHRRPSRARLLGVARCSVRGCWRDHYARGWCMRHYTQWLNHGRILDRDERRDDLTQEPGTCRARRCLRDAVVGDYCRKHAAQIRAHGKLMPWNELGIERLCGVRGCDEPHQADGLCMKHYNKRRWARRERNPGELGLLAYGPEDVNMNLVYRNPRTGGELWQAGASSANDPHLLDHTRIRAIVFAACENQPKMPEHFDVIRARLQDDPYMNKDTALRTARCADEVSDLILGYLSRGEKVVSSCWAGLNRSGLCTALTLVKLGATPEQAIARVRASRGPDALGNPVFVNIIRGRARRLARTA